MERTTFKHISESTGINPQVLKGLAIGMGVRMVRIGSADSISIEDARRMRERYVDHVSHAKETCQPVEI